MIEKLFRNRFFLIISLILYRFLLDAVYINFTNPLYNYNGFKINGGFEDYLVSWIIFIIVIIPAIPLWNKDEPFLPDVIVLLLLLRFIPTTTIIAFIHQPNAFLWEITIFWLLIICLSYFIRIPRIKPLLTNSIGNKTITISYVGVTMLIAVGVVVFISGYYAKFRLHLSLSGVYDLREESRRYNMPSLLSYLWGASSTILPLLFIYFFSKGKKLLSYFLGFCIILNFSINGLKSVVFSFAVCVLIYLLHRKNLKLIYTYGIIFLVIIPFIEPVLLGSNFIHNVIIRRSEFLPSILDTYYYDFYTKHSNLLHNSKVQIQFAIGQYYFNSIAMRCNNGLFSDGIINFGELGCFISPFIIIVYSKLCTKLFEYSEAALVSAFAFIFAHTIISSEFTTCLATHGLFFTTIILYLISSHNYSLEIITREE